MTATTDTEPVADPDDIMRTLLGLLEDAEGGSAARVQAAKILLDRLAPKQDDESKRREAEERRAALDEARCLLAEFAAAKSLGLYQPPALDQDRAPEPVDAGHAFDVIA